MGMQKSFLIVFCTIALANLCTSEYVPVFMWGTHRTSDPVPALHKTSQSSFQDEITNKLKNNPTIVVFAEQSLSPEDFGQRDRSGNIAYPNLSKLRKTSKVTYLSYVQNPVNAAKHASDDVSEISIEKLRDNSEIPESKIVIVDLDDARDNEERFNMLQRHDELIASIYDSLLKTHGNVLALYTAHHASWIGSREVHSRKARDLATSESKQNQYMDNTTIMFYTSGNVSVTTIVDKKSTVKSIPVTYSDPRNESDTFYLEGTGTVDSSTLTVSFMFTKSGGGYWHLQEANLAYEGKTLSKVTNASIYAPLGFSYACGDQTFTNENFTATFPSFQVQPAYKSSYLTKALKFDDPYNCVGFTTIPIWSGLFVTFILLLIMTFGLTMMMDIKTMDRFDDAKGKTITINTSE